MMEAFSPLPIGLSGPRVAGERADGGQPTAVSRFCPVPGQDDQYNGFVPVRMVQHAPFHPIRVMGIRFFTDEPSWCSI